MNIFYNNHFQVMHLNWERLGIFTSSSRGKIYGTLVHQTIEDIHKAAIQGENKSINKVQISSWFEKN
jgi:hypothetical protein